MNTSDFLLTIIIILIFIGLYFLNILGIGMTNIKKHWSLYRCNPLVIPFAGVFDKNVVTNFAWCIQNIQATGLSEFLAPVHYMMSIMADIGDSAINSLQYVRGMFLNHKNFLTDLIDGIMNLNMNLSLEMHKSTTALHDAFSKMMGVMNTLLFLLSGSMHSVFAVWAGGPGDAIRAACFHPNTFVKKSNGQIVKMKNIKQGDKLKNGKIVYATMIIHNLDENNNYIEKFYSLKNGENNSPILVTGSHLIFDKSINYFIPVKKYNAPISTISSDTLVCLITSDHTIPLGKYIFHDWEDNNECI